MKLKQLRREKQLTQQDIATFLGITRAAYTNLENGKRQPDIETLSRLADYYCVSVDYLLGRDPAPTQDAPPENSGRAEGDAMRTALEEGLAKLSDGQKDQLLAFLQFLLSQEEVDKKGP